MRRPRPRNQGPNVSLFPFLAVLICTMGVLIVLLVIVVQQARVEAHEATDGQLQADRQTRAQLETLQDDAQWRLDVLEASRSEMQTELREERLRLAGLEDHVRRLEQELQQLKDNSRAIQQPLDATLEEQAATRQNLAMLQAELQSRRQEMERARQKLSEHSRSFSIIAYRGPNGTRRRPVFIECFADRVIIQPEDVVLTERDFRGPLGPSNPLASALRAVREYHARFDVEGRWGEPYPLLIVRPGGAQAYATARRAMKSWDGEFGYELVDSEMELKYVDPDPALAERLRVTVEKARQRQVYLAKAAPSRYGSSDHGGGLVVSSRGGFESRGRGGAATNLSSWGNAGGGFGQRGGGGEEAVRQGESSKESRGRRVEGSWSDGSGDHRPGQQQGSRQPGQAQGENQPSREQGAEHDSGSTATRVGEGDANSNPGRKGGASTDPAGSSLGAASAAGGQAQRGSAIGSAAATPIAESRGNNWGLPNSSRSAIGFTRPIRVGLYSDRLVIHPEKGVSAPPQVIPMNQSTREAVDEFVPALWTYMERWGIAGNGLYWKPILVVESAPDAKNRLDELETLLDSSGIEVQRKTP